MHVQLLDLKLFNSLNFFMEKNHWEYLVTHIMCVTHILLYDVKCATHKFYQLL